MSNITALILLLLITPTLIISISEHSFYSLCTHISLNLHRVENPFLGHFLVLLHQI